MREARFCVILDYLCIFAKSLPGKIMDIKEFDSIRPYIDAEVPAAMERIAANPLLDEIAKYLFPGGNHSQLKKILLSCKTTDDFQYNVMAFVVNKILSDTAKNLTYGGLSNFDTGKKYLIITNHRDIVLDSAIINIILHNHNIQTTEIAVGDNLITSDFIEDIARTNKMIKVVRSTSPREVYTSSQRLSKYIRYNVASQKSSLWIAQRNGRTKDGMDCTEQGLLKMLEMSGSGNFIKDFSELAILPASISYEYEPCDVLKAIELYISKRRKYVKSENEDLNSILTGIMQFKGNIHIEFTSPISMQELEEAAKLDKNERFKQLAYDMDRRIISAYKLWGNNYIAYDILYDTDKYAGHYTPKERAEFESYLSYKLHDTEWNTEELKNIFLGIYANPIIQKEKIG